MTVLPTNVTQAYLNVLKSGASSGLDARDANKGSDFAAMVGEAAEAASKTIKAGETTTVEMMAGKADMTDVITAVTNAELALQTVVAVRDRVIQAYQDIIRMPI